jgi:dipeptidyl aminopeptidase/acylaminoacyl peptidase
MGGIDYRDIMAGVDHVIAEGIADPNRLGIAGCPTPALWLGGR